jgi:hypothetical protein
MKKKILAFCVIFDALSIFAQTTPPIFLDSLHQKSNYEDLFKVLNKLDDGNIRYKLQPCQAGMGVFSFSVTEKGAVDIANFEGNLPQEIIAMIKKNILSTSGKWSPALREGVAVESKPFILIYYATVRDCSEMPTYQQNEFHLGFVLEKAINTKSSRDIIELGHGYLLPVGGFFLMH